MLLLGPLLLAACESEPVDAAEPAIPLTGRIVDRADLLPAARERALNARLAQLERERGPQFVVVTVTSLDGRSINDFTLDLGRAWGIGSRERDDGVILLVAPNERKVRIEVGYGLEKTLKDEICAEIIREDILPAFRKGDMPGGIEDGANAIIQLLEAKRIVGLGLLADQPRMAA
ncbi:TPM domain-containing protein [Sphingomonas cavernae]|uniref:TPM domain-containing protein n=1 Tax=Sphingomonas cavernae TaxID=2320861 RepID=UPI001EE5488F|nr:TPM domain-containing protein [Sphingomonas cavernae]